MSDEPADLAADNWRLAPHFARWYLRRYPALADEIMSAAYFALLHAARTFDPARGSFSTHAGWTIRSHVGRAVFRERRYRGRFVQGPRVAGKDGEADDWSGLLADGREPAPDAAAELADEVARARRLSAGLSADRREDLERHFVDGETLTSLAAECGVTPEAVGSRVDRAVRRLRTAAGD